MNSLYKKLNKNTRKTNQIKEKYARSHKRNTVESREFKLGNQM